MESPDLIALVSVVSSMLVALATIAFNFASGERQRKHERRLALEERTWEAFSTAIYRVIGSSRALLDSLADVREVENNAPALATLAERHAQFYDMVGEVLPMMEAHATVDTRDRLISLREAVRWLRVGKDQIEEARATERDKGRAIDNEDFELAAEHRARQARQADNLRIVHQPALEDDLLELIASARENVAEERQPRRVPRGHPQGASQ